MLLIGDTRYIADVIEAMCERLVSEGLDIDLVLACMLDAAASGYANMEGAERMHEVFRETADQMEAGDYRLPPIDGPRRPTLTVIEGGGCESSQSP